MNHEMILVECGLRKTLSDSCMKDINTTSSEPLAQYLLYYCIKTKTN